jgi:hypothetical protein
VTDRRFAINPTSIATATAHQTNSATYTNTCAIERKNEASTACESRTVHTQYIPSGNTMPQ